MSLKISVMRQERLNDMAILAIERNLSQGIDLDCAVDTFADLAKARKLKLIDAVRCKCS